jgi:hypothetical protein
VWPPTLDNMTTAAISTPRPLRRRALNAHLVAKALTIVVMISVLAVGHGLASIPTAASFPMTRFGASEPVWIAHIGRIEVDLRPTNASALRRVPCDAAAAATTCFVPVMLTSAKEQG